MDKLHTQAVADTSVWGAFGVSSDAIPTESIMAGPLAGSAGTYQRREEWRDRKSRIAAANDQFIREASQLKRAGASTQRKSGKIAVYTVLFTVLITAMPLLSLFGGEVGNNAQDKQSSKAAYEQCKEEVIENVHLVLELKRNDSTIAALTRIVNSPL